MMHSWQSFPRKRQNPGLPMSGGSALSLSILKRDTVTSQRPYSLKYDWFVSGCERSVSLPWCVCCSNSQVLLLWRNFLAEQQLLPPAPEDTCHLLPGAHFIQWQTALRGSKGRSPLASSRNQLCNEIYSPARPGESGMKPASSRDSVSLIFPLTTHPHPHLISLLLPLLLRVIFQESTSTKIPISGSTCIQPDLTQ